MKTCRQSRAKFVKNVMMEMPCLCLLQAIKPLELYRKNTVYVWLPLHSLCGIFIYTEEYVAC